jgi:two-component system, cell cycle response regulator
MGERWTILVVDAGPSPLHAALEDAGARVLKATTAHEAIALLLDEPCAGAIVDVDLPGESGLVVLQHVRSSGSQMPLLLTMSRDDAVVRVEAFRSGADDCLTKPIEPDEVVARFQRRRSLHALLEGARGEATRLHELALTDGLTQVANHRYFQERLGEEFRRAHRYDDPLGLILVDLDHFKAINDTFGHQTGDEVLVGVAAAVRQAVRETDFVARYGGEEFAVLLPKTHLAGALTVAERMVVEVKRVRVGPHKTGVTASLGVSGFPGRSVTSPEQLIRTADLALYASKNDGRNKISLFQPQLMASVS